MIRLLSVSVLMFGIVFLYSGCHKHGNSPQHKKKGPSVDPISELLCDGPEAPELPVPVSPIATEVPEGPEMPIVPGGPNPDSTYPEWQRV